MDRVLYITKHNPWGQGGGSVASLMYLQAFRKVFANSMIDLCIAKNIPSQTIPTEIIQDKNINFIQVPSRSFMSKLLSPLTGITHRYQGYACRLLRENKYTHCVFDHSSIGGTLINKVPDGVKTIIIHHNFEPAYFADNTPNALVRFLLLPSVRKTERKSYKKSSVNIFLTKEDECQFHKVYGDTGAINLVTGLFDINENEKVNPVKTLLLDIPTIVITGSLNNVQNIDGIRYFVQELYPMIPTEYKIIIAGQKPDKEIINMVDGLKNIELIPDPECMDDVIHRGNIFLSPARVGGGIKVRITDGLKCGLPVIAHEVSARGYDKYVERGYFKFFESPTQFKHILTDTVSTIYDNKYSSENISNFYKKNSNLGVVIKSLKNIL